MPFFSSFSGSFKPLQKLTQFSINLRHRIANFDTSSQAVGDGDIDFTTGNGDTRVFIGQLRDFNNSGAIHEIDPENGTTSDRIRFLGAPNTREGWGVAYAGDKLLSGAPGSNNAEGRLVIYNGETLNFEDLKRSPFGTTDGAFYGWAVTSNRRPDLADMPIPWFAASAPKFNGGELVEVRSIDQTNNSEPLINEFVTPVDGNDFGKKIALVGETLYVAALGNNTVYVYDVRDSAAPTYSVTDNTPGFARGIFATVDKLFVSASDKVFVYNSTTGNLLHTIDDPLPNSDGTGTRFGYGGLPSQGISATDDLLLIGAPISKFADGRAQGRVHIFDTNTYELLSTLENPNPINPSSGDATLGGQFGNNVLINQDYIVITAKFNTQVDPPNTPSEFHGNAYIYNYSY